MCEALGPPHILGASRAASASPGGVYEKTRFRKNRKFWSQLFKLESMLFTTEGLRTTVEFAQELAPHNAEGIALLRVGPKAHRPESMSKHTHDLYAPASHPTLRHDAKHADRDAQTTVAAR